MLSTIKRQVPRLVIVTILFGLFAEPVLAQTGLGLAKEAVCGTRASNIIGAVWVLGVFGLPLYGAYRVANGMRKMSTHDSGKKKTGREEVKSSTWSFGAAVFLLGIERVFAFLGIALFECVNFSLV